MNSSSKLFNLVLLILLIAIGGYWGEKRAIVFQGESWEKTFVVHYARII